MNYKKPIYICVYIHSLSTMKKDRTYTKIQNGNLETGRTLQRLICYTPYLGGNRKRVFEI